MGDGARIVGMEGSDDVEGAGKNTDLAMATTKENIVGSRTDGAEFGALASLAIGRHCIEAGSLTLNREALSLPAGFTSETSKKLNAFHFDA